MGRRANAASDRHHLAGDRGSRRGAREVDGPATRCDGRARASRRWSPAWIVSPGVDRIGAAELHARRRADLVEVGIDGHERLPEAAAPAERSRRGRVRARCHRDPMETPPDLPAAASVPRWDRVAPARPKQRRATLQRRGGSDRASTSGRRPSHRWWRRHVRAEPLGQLQCREAKWRRGQGLRWAGN